MVTILCVDKNSNYKKVEGINYYDEDRDAFNYVGDGPVIAHPPCAQWSKLRRFATFNSDHLHLAEFCVSKVYENGGILEHPEGSLLFKKYGIPRSQIRSVDQSWFGFPARKVTWLWCNGVSLDSFPIFGFVEKGVQDIHTSMRSRMPLSMCNWLVNSVNNGYGSKEFL